MAIQPAIAAGIRTPIPLSIYLLLRPSKESQAKPTQPSQPNRAELSWSDRIGLEWSGLEWIYIYNTAPLVAACVSAFSFIWDVDAIASKNQRQLPKSQWAISYNYKSRMRNIFKRVNPIHGRKSNALNFVDFLFRSLAICWAWNIAASEYFWNISALVFIVVVVICIICKLINNAKKWAKLINKVYRLRCN